MLLLMPCGFHLAETVDEWSRTAAPPWLGELSAARAGAVYALDGSAYFSRPGPRVIDGVEILAGIMDPDAFGDVAPAGGWVQVEVA
jgi:iron complex transport system substrate-binding protein